MCPGRKRVIRSRRRQEQQSEALFAWRYSFLMRMWLKIEAYEKLKSLCHIFDIIPDVDARAGYADILGEVLAAERVSKSEVDIRLADRECRAGTEMVDVPCGCGQVGGRARNVRRVVGDKRERNHHVCG